MARKDLTGQKFGHLTVLSFDEEKTKLSGITHWICQCDGPNCKPISVSASNLIRGNTTKCKHCRAKNLIGRKFGRLTVIERIIDKNDHVLWKAICECGSEIVVRGDSLRSGHTRSCGCLQKDTVSEITFRDLTGQTFGLLTVTRLSKKRAKDGGYYWYCDCACGAKNHEVNGHHLKAGNIVSCGCCKSKGELKIATLLASAKIPFKKQYTPENFVFPSGKKPKFDFAVLNYDGTVSYLIEYQIFDNL